MAAEPRPPRPDPPRRKSAAGAGHARAAVHPPWSCFDYAETQLYLGRPDAFIQFIDRGIEFSTVDWMPKTAADTLRLLVERGIDLPRLRDGIEKLDAAAKMLAGAGI